jgi:hypothetical protein
VLIEQVTTFLLLQAHSPAHVLPHQNSFLSGKVGLFKGLLYVHLFLEFLFVTYDYSTFSCQYGLLFLHFCNIFIISVFLLV